MLEDFKDFSFQIVSDGLGGSGEKEEGIQHNRLQRELQIILKTLLLPLTGFITFGKLLNPTIFFFCKMWLILAGLFGLSELIAAKIQGHQWAKSKAYSIHCIRKCGINIKSSPLFFWKGSKGRID